MLAGGVQRHRQNKPPHPTKHRPAIRILIRTQSIASPEWHGSKSKPPTQYAAATMITIKASAGANTDVMAALGAPATAPVALT